MQGTWAEIAREQGRKRGRLFSAGSHCSVCVHLLYMLLRDLSVTVHTFCFGESCLISNGEEGGKE